MMSHGTNYSEVYRQVGDYVGSVLNGEKPENWWPIYNVLDDEPAPRHSYPQAPLGSDHSRHCGSFPGSPSRVSGQATWRSIAPIGVP
jgi:hypothetical protein